MEAYEKRGSAAGDDAFFNRSAGSVHRIFDTIALFLHFDFGRTADPDNSNTAGELRQTFLQLLTVVIRAGLIDLSADLVATALDVGLLAGAVHDCGFFLGDRDFLGGAEHVERDVFELDAEIFRTT